MRLFARAIHYGRDCGEWRGGSVGAATADRVNAKWEMRKEVTITHRGIRHYGTARGHHYEEPLAAATRWANSSGSKGEESQPARNMLELAGSPPFDLPNAPSALS